MKKFFEQTYKNKPVLIFSDSLELNTLFQILFEKLNKQRYHQNIICADFQELMSALYHFDDEIIAINKMETGISAWEDE